MKTEDFLASMGWPQDRMGEAGLAKWSGSSADEFSTVRATIARAGSKIEARVDRLGLDGSENMLAIEAQAKDGAVSLSKTQAGSPPDEIPAEDAIHLFKFMSAGLGKFAFESTGPMDMPSKTRPAV